MSLAKKWLLTCGVSIAVMLVLIFALVVYVDPFFQYHKPLENFPYFVDNQISQNPGMAKNMQYDSAILGSSMTVNFNTNWFKEEMGLDTIKLSYSGAYPKDQSNIMDIMFKSDNDIKAVFLGVDVITYSGGLEETKYPIPKYLYDDNKLNDIQYIFNKDVILNYILRQIASPEKTDLATVYASWWTDDYYNIQWVMHNYTQPEQATDEVPADAYVQSILDNLDVNICPYIEANKNTEFYVFFPPYSILFWNDVLRENQMEATLRKYECITERLMQYENVRIFFFPDQADIVTDLNNYADYTHYHPRYNHFMTECFANGYCEIHSMEELQEALTRIRDMVDAFDFEELTGKEW